MSATTGVSLDVVRELRAVCGEDHVVDTPEQLKGCSSNICSDPAVAIWPGSAEEVVAVLQLAGRKGLGIIPAGGRTQPVFGENQQPYAVLCTSRLTEVEHYDHADLTVGVGAGMTVAQLNAMVSADHLVFAPDPRLPERCTIGGLLATAGQGPLRHGYGGVRDFCIGVRFVTGDGRRAKGGGRVVKNVAGYDLMKLLIGSYGTLAVITSASFKLFPAPRQTRTFLAEFASATEALQFRDLIMRSPLAPMCLELVSPGAGKLMRPETTSDAWVMCVRASGSDAVLARYRKELGSAITREVDGEDEVKLWRGIQDFPINAEDWQDNARIHWLSLVVSTVSVVVPPADVHSVIEIVMRAAVPEVYGAAVVGRVGIGHVLAYLWIMNDEAPSDPSARVIDELGTRLSPLANISRSGARSPWALPPAQLMSMRAVKRALDPNNVLRGREIF